MCSDCIPIHIWYLWNVQCLKSHDYDHITFSESSKLRLEMKFLLLSIHVHISCCICSTSKVTLFLHWRSKSSGMWCCVVQQLVPEVLKERGVFNTTGTTSPTTQKHIPEDLQLQQQTKYYHYSHLCIFEKIINWIGYTTSITKHCAIHITYRTLYKNNVWN